MDDSIPERESSENAGPPGHDTLLILDFDGVLCDSVAECYVSSWHARRGTTHPHPGIDPQGPYGRFARMRPFVRSGEDFLLIQEAIDLGLQVADQTAFDALIARAGPARMGEHRKALYRVREHLVETEPDYWLGLNRVYPHLQDLLGPLAADRRTYILSTKRSDLVNRILHFWGVALDATRVIEPGASPKLRVVQELIRRRGTSAAVFLDDQVDHFTGARRLSSVVDCRLAAWGYVKPEWLQSAADYQVLGIPEARDLLQRWLTSAANGP